MADSGSLIWNRDHARRRVSEYFNQALRRPRDQLLPIQGNLVEAGRSQNSQIGRGNNSLHAQFYLDVCDNYVKAATYKCTTCVTLVVYCERLTEMAVGLSLEETMKIEPSDLVEEFPEVPTYKRDRADFAVQALQSAVNTATSDVPSSF